MFSGSSEDTDSSLAAALTKNLSLFRWELMITYLWAEISNMFLLFFLTCLIGQSSSCTSQVPKIPESWQQQPAGGSHCEFNTGSVCFQKLKLWCSFQHFLIIKFLGALFSSSFCFPTNVVGGLHNKFYLYSSVSSSWREKKACYLCHGGKAFIYVCLSVSRIRAKLLACVSVSKSGQIQKLFFTFVTFRDRSVVTSVSSSCMCVYIFINVLLLHGPQQYIVHCL